MKIKFGRNVLEISARDAVLFNGACYQIVTKEVGGGWHGYPPIVSKKQAQEFIKKGILKTDAETEELKEKHYRNCKEKEIYRFDTETAERNIEWMEKKGYIKGQQ